MIGLKENYQRLKSDVLLDSLGIECREVKIDCASRFLKSHHSKWLLDNVAMNRNNVATQEKL